MFVTILICIAAINSITAIILLTKPSNHKHNLNSYDYYCDTTKTIEAHYINGVRQSWIEYYPNGKIKSKKVYDSKGNLISLDEFREDIFTYCNIERKN